MSRMNTRLSNHVDPKETEVVVMPAEHVDITDIEHGTDGAMVNLVNEINDQRTVYAQTRDDQASLGEIATSLEEFTMLAMEGIGAETGLEAQSLLTMQYGVNHHLKRIGQSMTFPSLESNDVGNLEKTILTVEGLGDAIGKVWDGLVNVAKRALESVGTFFKHMLDFYAAMRDKFTKLKSQLLALEDKATGEISTSAAKRLWYGESSYRQLLPMLQALTKTTNAYVSDFKTNGLNRSAAIVKELTGVDKDGFPTVNPQKVKSYIVDEQKRRDALLGLGYGSAPRQGHLDHRVMNLKVDYSKGLPGGYRLVSHSPVFNDRESAVGDAVAVMEDCTFELEANKVSGAPSTMPVLSIKDSIAMCDMMLDMCKNLDDAISQTIDNGQAFWELEDDGALKKLEASFNKLIALDKNQLKAINKEISAGDAVARGMAAGWNIVARGSILYGIVSGVVAAGATGSAAMGCMVFLSATGVCTLAFVIPGLVIGGALGLLFKNFMTKSNGEMAEHIRSDDPNAPILHILRAVLSARSWIGMYTVDTVYAVCDYYTKIGPALLDYIGDSAKAHLKAQKADVSDAAAEPALA